MRVQRPSNLGFVFGRMAKKDIPILGIRQGEANCDKPDVRAIRL